MEGAGGGRTRKKCWEYEYIAASLFVYIVFPFLVGFQNFSVSVCLC